MSIIASVRNSEVSARRELTVTRNPLTIGILIIKTNSNNSVGNNLVDDNLVHLNLCHWSHYYNIWSMTDSVKSQASYKFPIFPGKATPQYQCPDKLTDPSVTGTFKKRAPKATDNQSDLGI